MHHDTTPDARQAGVLPRAIEVLGALSRHADTGVGVRELAAKLDLSRSAVHRILQTLADAGVAQPLPTGRYAPGMVMLTWASALASRHSLLTVGGTILDGLAATTGETTFLTTYRAGDLFTTSLLVRLSDKAVQHNLPAGYRIPLHAGGSGKAVLAALPDSVAQEIPLERFSDTTIVGRRKLMAEVAEIRERGYAVGIGEVASDVCGVAAAWTIDDHVAGSVCISTPRYRFSESDVPRLGALVSEAAHNLTRLMSQA